MRNIYIKYTKMEVTLKIAIKILLKLKIGK